MTATASDANGSAEQTFPWTVTSPVTLTNPGSQTTAAGAAPTLTLTGNDTSGGTLSFTASGLPSGLTLSSAGVISGSITAGDPLGVYAVNVTASDANGSAGQTFFWNVTNPVTLAGVADQTTPESGTPTLTLSASDASGGTLTYSALGLPAGLAVNPATGAVTGTVALGGRRRWSVPGRRHCQRRLLPIEPPLHLDSHVPADADRAV